jgi:sugar phosphate isomerase/epimerase
MKTGVILESFATDIDTAILKAKQVGADGIQMYADKVVDQPDPIKACKELKKKVNDQGMVFSALCGDFGCKMFYEPTQEEIDREKKCLDLAFELGTKIVTTHIGVVPEETNCIQYETMHKVCKILNDYAVEMGGHYAIETGPEKAVILKSFLDTLNGAGMGVNFDPANLVMCAGDDPVKAVHTLKDYIVHTHAKDGIQLKPYDTRRIYAAKYYGLPPADERTYQEVALGEGNVDWKNYLSALKEIGYNGFLTVERECGADPAKDILTAVTFLKLFIERNKL